MSVRPPDVARPAVIAAGPGEAAIRAAVAALLQSVHFAHAPRLSRFLQYIVDEALAGRSAAIKEYALAADVFGRGADYDSSTDAIVRVEAGRLRQKLHAYYDGEGRTAAVRIDLPKGSYVPVFLAHAPGPLVAPSPPAPVPRGVPRVWYAVVLLLGMVVIGSVAMLRTREGDARGAGGTRGATSSDQLATDAYLKGQYLRSQMTPAGIRDAATHFGQAIARDPAFAAAWAARGEARATLAFHGFEDPRTAFGLARRDIQRALAVDPAQAEARGVLARVHLSDDFDWRRAELEFRRALLDAPANARLHMWFAFALASRGRFDEALEESQRATELNPSAYVGTTDGAVLHFFARRYGEALAQARGAHAVNDRMGVAHVIEGMCLAATGRHAEAVEAYRQALDTDVTVTAVHAKLAHVYGVMGHVEEASRYATELAHAFGSAPVPALDRALVAIGRGDADAAIAALDDGIERREGDLVFLGVHPLLDPLRAHPRFDELRQKAGM